MRNPFRRKGHAGLDGSALYGRHAANPAEVGYARGRRWGRGDHATPPYTIRDRIHGLPEPEPKIREARPIRKVPGNAAREASDGVAKFRQMRERDMKTTMRNRQRGDNPRRNLEDE